MGKERLGTKREGRDEGRIVCKKRGNKVMRIRCIIRIAIN